MSLAPVPPIRARAAIAAAIRAHPKGLTRQHVAELVAALRAEGWVRRVTILAAARDFLSEVLAGDPIPLHLRRDQTRAGVIRAIRQDLQGWLPAGEVDHGDSGR